ncbi:MAG: TlpA family protein disulfide reductase [Microscillaceae bacterium]|nr:TlpA family protein disulfide reductase [Microscillaceae bacterium]MDW8461570.1 TlpA disulfide reductase family protein [Cytophagales bacterium]
MQLAWQIFLFCVISFKLCTFLSCQPNRPQEAKLTAGIWRFAIQTAGGEVPFQVDFQQSEDKKWRAYILNGKERLLLDEIEVNKDSIKMTLHVFNAALVGKLNDKSIKGRWIKYDYPDYSLPFEATAEVNYRFQETNTPARFNFSGKWKVQFTAKNGKSYPAVGIFEQEGKKITGTFLTTTGDYRFLEGIVEDKQLKLSTFDGAHAFLFKASLKDEQTLTGEFWAGKTGFEEWVATKNDTASLPNAEKLTFLKEGYNEFNFTFPNLDKQPVSLKDAKYKNKVVIVQLFGSWCPNCRDETEFLAPWYAQNKHRGVEIIALAYERSADFNKAKERVRKVKEKLKAEYDFLIAGVSNKNEASKTLPMLNQVLAFPTTIFIDKKGQVRKIHTGFNGPGTGKYYEQFVKEFNDFVNQLLKE